MINIQLGRRVLRTMKEVFIVVEELSQKDRMLNSINNKGVQYGFN